MTLHQFRNRISRIGLSQCVRSDTHSNKTFGIVEKRFDLGQESITSQVGIRDEACGSRSDERRGVRGLVIARSLRERNKDGSDTSFGQFSHGGAPTASDQKIGGGKNRIHMVFVAHGDVLKTVGLGKLVLH